MTNKEVYELISHQLNGDTKPLLKEVLITNNWDGLQPWSSLFFEFLGHVFYSKYVIIISLYESKYKIECSTERKDEIVKEFLKVMLSL